MNKLIKNNLFAKPTLEVAPRLIGMIMEVGEVAGRIVEVEAYTDDPASHGFTRTARSAIMHDTCGFVYVYFIYGMYYCVNFTTEKGRPGAVLIRAVEPLTGIPLMQKRRHTDNLHALCSGPGKLCAAFGIDQTFNGSPIGEKIKLYAGEAGSIAAGPRIGITKAADLHWRFFEAENPFVSKHR